MVSLEFSDRGADFGSRGGAIFTFDTYCATLPWVDLAFAAANAFRVAGVLRVLVVLVVRGGAEAGLADVAVGICCERLGLLSSRHLASQSARVSVSRRRASTVAS